MVEEMSIHWNQYQVSEKNECERWMTRIVEEWFKTCKTLERITRKGRNRVRFKWYEGDDEIRTQQLKKKQTTLEEQKENQRDQHQLQLKSFDSNLWKTRMMEMENTKRVNKQRFKIIKIRERTEWCSVIVTNNSVKTMKRFKKGMRIKQTISFEHVV